MILMRTREYTVDAKYHFLRLAKTFDSFAVLRTSNLIYIEIVWGLHRIQAVRQLNILIIVIIKVKRVIVFYLNLIRLEFMYNHFLALGVLLFDIKVLEELFVRRPRKIYIG